MKSENERFLAKTIKGTNPDDCWEWVGAKYRGGYGHIGMMVDGKWKMVKAHRYSYAYYKGGFDDSLFVCHSCDNPGCVNPDHLFLGTAQDNVDDMIKKKRAKSGRNPNHKHLTQEIVDGMRQDYANGLRQIDICLKYNQSRTQVHRVVNNLTWSE
jgi:hypothetical protein